ncbi:MAG: TIM barrel protein [Oscillospiraceae bacterium]|nr:TIM barrel protein [Oscillospiraceae bacterium]
MIVFATAGKSNSFKGKYPHDLPEHLESYGLNGFEVQCGRGVNVSDEVCDLFTELTNADRLHLSLHAPYFISLSSVELDTREKSIGYILESARIAKRIGAKRIVVHSGSCAKISREVALGYSLKTLKKARAILDEEGLSQIMICPETMGKVNQLGTLEEVIELCSFDERMLPCIDFGHLNARTFGGLKGRGDYATIFEAIQDKLGSERLKQIHVHFSKIEYTVPKIGSKSTGGGEKKHLTFDDCGEFGPDYEPFLEEVAKRQLQPFIVCESNGTQAEDCAVMKKYWQAQV